MCLGRGSGRSTLYTEYHDTEWGRPLYGRDALFERLCLEAFQSGLAWITILRKREGFRRAFDGFRPEKVARYTDQDIARLMADAEIVRNRAKIESAISMPAPSSIWTPIFRTCCGRLRRNAAPGHSFFRRCPR